MSKKAYLAGGCFWGLEELFRKQKGIIDTETGYTGGHNENPTYEHHPGHAEALEITYDDTQIDFWHLLDFFFCIHNPTTLNQQGNDKGVSYRSAIFYQNEEEKQQAEAFIDLVNNSHKWNDPIVTTIEPFTVFYKAEEHHQNYLQKHPGGYTCHVRYIDSYLSPSSFSVNEEVLKNKLTEEEYHILRQKGTEAPFSGKTITAGNDGAFHCKVCNAALFSKDAKFESGTGWPSFDQALPHAIIEITDTSHEMIRTEIQCAVCHSHLGHVFTDGPTITGKRYCTNSLCFQ